MTRSEGDSAVVGGDTVVAAVTAGYRASGHECRVVEHGRDTYVRVWGGGTDGLVWVRPDHDGTDTGLSRFALECERYGVADRQVLSTDERDPVAPHAASLGIGFSGPSDLASALQSMEVPVPFETDGEPATADSAGEQAGESGTRAGLIGRLGGAFLTLSALSLGLLVVGLF